MDHNFRLQGNIFIIFIIFSATATLAQSPLSKIYITSILQQLHHTFTDCNSVSIQIPLFLKDSQLFSLNLRELRDIILFEDNCGYYTYIWEIVISRNAWNSYHHGLLITEYLSTKSLAKLTGVPRFFSKPSLKFSYLLLLFQVPITSFSRCLSRSSCKFLFNNSFVVVLSLFVLFNCISFTLSCQSRCCP